MPPSTAKPMASGSFGAGRVTFPKSALFRSRSSVAPSPMYSRASDTRTESRSPARVWVPSPAGSTTPVTRLRLILTVALPYTTSAIPMPTVPPISKPWSAVRRLKPLKTNEACTQSRAIPPATEVLFCRKTRFVAIIWRSLTPCN